MLLAWNVLNVGLRGLERLKWCLRLRNWILVVHVLNDRLNYHTTTVVFVLPAWCWPWINNSFDLWWSFQSARENPFNNWRALSISLLILNSIPQIPIVLILGFSASFRLLPILHIRWQLILFVQMAVIIIILQEAISQFVQLLGTIRAIWVNTVYLVPLRTTRSPLWLVFSWTSVLCQIMILSVLYQSAMPCWRFLYSQIVIHNSRLMSIWWLWRTLVSYSNEASSWALRSFSNWVHWIQLHYNIRLHNSVCSLVKCLLVQFFLSLQLVSILILDAVARVLDR